MFHSPESSRTPNGADPKSFSCLICRQRKIKCDRLNPCSNCVKAARQCSFIAPVRGKPKRRKAPKEGLHAKVRRYEEMLKSYGAVIEPSDYNNTISDEEMISEPDAEIVKHSEPCDNTKRSSISFDETKTKLVTKNGSSRYFDTGIWPDLGSEFRHPEEDGFSEGADDSTAEAPDHFVDSFQDFLGENDLVLNTRSTILTGLHHPLRTLERIMDIYRDRVDPLIKILHLPTFWSTLTTAIQTPHTIPKSLEAIIFAIYFVTTISFDDNECYDILGEQKAIVSKRYRIASRQALINAEFLNTSSLMTLQAYVIFLMGMRHYWQSSSLYILSGIAVRLARRMGLHRDGTSLGLSPFETEMRRRLWWHIVHMDCRTSDLSGAKPSMDIFLSDTKKPLNIEDEDLSPDMVNRPLERTGITVVVHCLVRCDIMDFLRRIAPTSSYESQWDNLSDATITPAEKHHLINEMEDTLEGKYLRYCDPSNPLHLFSSILARSSICKMKLFAHNPRQFANSGVKIPQKSREIIFASGMKMMEYTILLHTNQSLQKFMWQLNTTYYIWEALVYVLIELRYRKIGPEVDRAWQLIGGIFSNHPQIFEETTKPVYAALGNWTLRVWDDCVAGKKIEGLPESSTPEYITAIRRCRRPSATSSSKQHVSRDYGRAIGNQTGYNEIESQGIEGNQMSGLEPLDSYDFSNLLSFDLEPNEWVQWEQLLAGQGFSLG